MARGNYETHRFFCIRCGKEGIPLMRKQGHKHTDFHRKKLYCPYCKMEINHVECKTQADVNEFKENFKNEVYKDEVEESLAYLRSAGLG